MKSYLIFIFFSTSCKVGDYKITDAAMFPNFNIEDVVSVNKEKCYDYGDVIVMWIPDSLRILDESYRIYRVVALPGDTIIVDNNHCVINNQRCSLRFVKKLLDPDNVPMEIEEEILPGPQRIMIGIRPNSPYPEMENMPSCIIPQNNYFVLGDNRTGSLDSRYIGPIPIENIKGKVTKVIQK